MAASPRFELGPDRFKVCCTTIMLRGYISMVPPRGNDPQPQDFQSYVQTSFIKAALFINKRFYFDCCCFFKSTRTFAVITSFKDCVIFSFMIVNTFFIGSLSSTFTNTAKNNLYFFYHKTSFHYMVGDNRIELL